MAFYLFQASYTPTAMKAMVENPQDREAAARSFVAACGATIHHFFFSFGKSDVVVLIEAPDDVSMVAATMALGASGALSSGATTKLITGSEAMAAMKMANNLASSYKPPTSG